VHYYNKQAQNGIANKRVIVYKRKHAGEELSEKAKKMRPPIRLEKKSQKMFFAITRSIANTIQECIVTIIIITQYLQENPRLDRQKMHRTF